MMESVDNETASTTTFEQVKESRRIRRKGPRRLIDYTKRGKFLPFSSFEQQQQQQSSSPGKIKKSCSDTIIRDKRQIQQRKEELQTKEKISSSPMTRNEGRQRRQRRRRQCNTMSSLKVRPIANYRNRKLSVLRTKWNNNKKSSCERDEEGRHRRRRRRRRRRSSTHEKLSKSFNSFFTNGKKGISNVRKSISNTLLNSLTFSINKDDDDECNEKSSSLFLMKCKAQEQQQQEIMEEEEEKKRIISKNCTITLNKDATDIIPQDEEGKDEEEKIGFFLKIPPKHDRQYRHSDLREQYPPLDSSDSSVVSSSIFLAQQQHVVNEKNRERIRKRRNSISAFFNRRIPRRKTLKHWKTKTKSSRRLELEGGGRKKKISQ